MQSVKVIVVGVMSLIVVGHVCAATQYSTTWEGSYEADIIPSSNGWIEISSADTYATLPGGGFLRMDTVSFDVGAWYRRDISLDLSTGVATGVGQGPGVSMEWRLKMLDYEGSQTSTAACRWYIYADDGAGNIKQASMGISETRAGLAGDLYTMDATDNYHVYRYTADSAGFKFYIDGELVKTGVLDATTGSTGLQFGDVTGVQDSDYQVDYVRWTDGGAFAPPSVTAESSTWEGSYEADVIPSSNGWIEVSSADTYATLPGGGVFRMDTVNFNAGAWYKRDNVLSLTSGSPAGMSMEWRLKMLDYEGSQTAMAACLWYIHVDDGAGNMKLQNIGISETRAGPTTDLYTMDTTDDYHVYRYTADSAGFKFYVDGELVKTGAFIAGTAPARLQFGDVTGVQDSDYLLDYVRWTDRGAFPIPVTGTLLVIK